MARLSRIRGRQVEPRADGSYPSHVPLKTLDGPEMMEMFRKGIGAPTPAAGGLSGGFLSYENSFATGYRTGPARLAKLLSAYGGTEQSPSWIFQCVSLVASTAAAYPWALVNDTGEVIEAPPADLVSLLHQPNPRWTYFDMIEAILTDLEMVGNHYLLKNERNGIGQPKSLFRLRPERVQIALTPDGTVSGYVYSMPNGLQIPYDADEVIHFKYPNPMDPNYGMGTVEAIASVADRAVAQGGHITGFFQNGARISGVLTISGTMSDIQFERLKATYESQFAGDSAAYKMLIAEAGAGGSTDYKPITQGPAAAGVVDLMGVTKDETLAAWGVPAPMLGGLMENANYKMEDAQVIFLRAMIPRARRTSERLTLGLASLWDVVFRQEPEANEPMSVRIGYAKDMLGAGASMRESRKAMSLAPLQPGDRGYDQQDTILIPNNLIPIEIAGQPPRPATSMPMDANPERGAAPIGSTGTGALPPGPDPNTGRTPTLEEHLAGLPAAIAAASGKSQLEVVAALRALARANGGDGGGSDDEPSDPADGKAVSLTPVEPTRPGLKHAAVGLARVWASPRALARKEWQPPALPRGFEPILKTADMPVEHQSMRDTQAVSLRQAVDLYEPMFRSFFREQRGRVIDRLSDFGDVNGRAARLRHSPKKKKDDLTIKDLFPAGEENDALKGVYQPTAREAAYQSAQGVDAAINADFTSEEMGSVADAVAKHLSGLVTRVNDTTRQAIDDVVVEGLRRSYSIPQIANGYPDEGYPGIMGVFDQADAARAEVIARTESALAFNGAQTDSLERLGATHVQILDGTESDEACFVGSTLVVAPELRATYSRWYEGEVVEVATSDGNEITCTPNHPILTRRGWVRASELVEGDDLVGCRDAHGLAGLRAGSPDRPDDHDVPTAIEEIVNLAEVAASGGLVCKATRTGDFHGDGVGSEVHVVATCGDLGAKVEPALVAQLCEKALLLAAMRTKPLASAGAGGQGGVCLAGTTPSMLGGPDASETTLGGATRSGDNTGLLRATENTLPSHEVLHGISADLKGGGDLTGGGAVKVEVDRPGLLTNRAGMARVSSREDEAVADGDSTETRVLSDLADRMARLMHAQNVFQVRKRAFIGRTYNLATRQRWYLAEGIIVHNCREANGQVWALSEYRENPIQHPQCSRTAVRAEAPVDDAATAELASALS